MTRRRETYLGLLVLIALALVVATDVVGWAGLPLLFPVAGILFASGGAQVAGGLDEAGWSRRVQRTTVVRLLIPFWIAAAVLVPVMLAHGWTADENAGSAPLGWGNGWLWLLPLADPPVSTDGLAWTTGLWFARTYLWLLLLAPPLTWLFRRWPVRVIAVPVVVLLLISSGLANLEGGAFDVVTGLCAYAVCWLLGIAYRDGTLLRLRPAGTLLGGAALIGAGFWSARVLGAQYEAGSAADVPPAAMLVSAGATLILLRISPAFGWLGRVRWTGAALGFLRRRALTVVLWAGAAAAVAPTVLERFTKVAEPDLLLDYAVACALLLVLMLVVGWVEAVASTPGRRLTRPWRRPHVEVPVGAERTFVLEGNLAADEPGVAPDGAGRLTP